jgi:acetyl esterase
MDASHLKSAFLVLLTLVSLALILFMSVRLVLRYWTRTPHGKLNVASAIISRLSAREPLPQNAAGIAAMRAKRRAALPKLTTPGPSLPLVQEHNLSERSTPLPARLYRPIESADELPLVLFFHGGGWVLGDLDSHDNLCRRIAAESGAQVLAVDYRLAPEHAYPAAVDDAETALRWVLKNAELIRADLSRIAVAGDSSGGNIAAALALRVREIGLTTLRAQVLIYPALDATKLTRSSMEMFGTGYFLTRARMQWFIERYLPDPAQRNHPQASPLTAPDLSGLPPTLILTAQFDPLRDEGEEYAARLRAAEVITEEMRIPGVIHGFASIDRWFPEATAAGVTVGDFLRRHMAD